MYRNAQAKWLIVLLFACGLGACASTTKDSSSAVRVASDAQPVQSPVVAKVEPIRFAQKYSLNPGQALEIANDFGDVHLRFGGFAHELELSAVAQAPEGAPAPTVRFDAKTGRYDSYLPEGSVIARGQRADMVAFVPEGHAVTVQTLAGDVEVRSVRADVTIRSNSGAISARGVRGAIDAQTGSGSIEVAFVDDANAPKQRLETSTGLIMASFGPQANARINVATSGLIGTEYSVEVTPAAGQEPNKTGKLLLGAGEKQIEIQSKRGELRLYRRSGFVEVEH